jgi:hypothetical protein
MIETGKIVALSHSRFSMIKIPLCSKDLRCDTIKISPCMLKGPEHIGLNFTDLYQQW